VSRKVQRDACSDQLNAYRVQVAQDPDGWYNTSTQLNRQGVPFGFAPRILPGIFTSIKC